MERGDGGLSFHSWCPRIQLLPPRADSPLQRSRLRGGRLRRGVGGGAEQRLATTSMTLRAALANLDGPDPAARELVEEALEQAEHANTELRELAQGILPPALTAGGRGAGVTGLVGGA